MEISYWNLAMEQQQRNMFSFQPVTVPDSLGLLNNLGGLEGLGLKYGCYELGVVCSCSG